MSCVAAVLAQEPVHRTTAADCVCVAAVVVLLHIVEQPTQRRVLGFWRLISTYCIVHHYCWIQIFDVIDAGCRCFKHTA